MARLQMFDFLRWKQHRYSQPGRTASPTSALRQYRLCITSRVLRAIVERLFLRAQRTIALDSTALVKYE